MSRVENMCLALWASGRSMWQPLQTWLTRHPSSVQRDRLGDPAHPSRRCTCCRMRLRAWLAVPPCLFALARVLALFPGLSLGCVGRVLRLAPDAPHRAGNVLVGHLAIA